MENLKVVCPKKGEAVQAEFLGQGVISKEVWEAADQGLSGAQNKSWMSVKVKCPCGEIHEYALTMHPK